MLNKTTVARMALAVLLLSCVVVGVVEAQAPGACRRGTANCPYVEPAGYINASGNFVPVTLDAAGKIPVSLGIGTTAASPVYTTGTMTGTVTVGSVAVSSTPNAAAFGTTTPARITVTNAATACPTTPLASRKLIMLQNLTTAGQTVYCGKGSGTTTGNATILLPPGGSWTWPSAAADAWYCIVAAGSEELIVTEGT